jgi:hypothetical protein
MDTQLDLARNFMRKNIEPQILAGKTARLPPNGCVCLDGFERQSDAVVRNAFYLSQKKSTQGEAILCLAALAVSLDSAGLYGFSTGRRQRGSKPHRLDPFIPREPQRNMLELLKNQALGEQIEAWNEGQVSFATFN